ncbi:MAG: UDP-2,3-diacylglucosamine diphosphatase, partial [Pedobacter sp.]
MIKRPVDLAVVSDLHLGTYACRATEFVSYLQTIDPRMLILNGDIVDAWQFSKHYFPPAHIAVIQEILQLMSNGTRVVYITGNHDETLRRYSDLSAGNFQLTDKILIEVDGKTSWIFHGDVFDRTTRKQAKFWSKLGSNGYALLLGFNKGLNKLMHWLGYEKLSLSKKLMHQFHKRIVRVEEFETMIAELAIEKKYDYVICGHIHEPKKRIVETDKGSVCYLNSGDWVEHSTALEYYNNAWQLFNFESSEIKTEK